MNRIVMLISFILMGGCLLFGVQSDEEPLYTLAFEKPVSPSLVEASVHKSLVRRRWNITSRSPGVFEASFNADRKLLNFSHSRAAAFIKIVFSDAKADFYLVATKPEKARPPRRVVGWVHNLKQDLNRFLERE